MKQLKKKYFLDGKAGEDLTTVLHTKQEAPETFPTEIYEDLDGHYGIVCTGKRESFQAFKF
jgi:hypothetical protein